MSILDRIRKTVGGGEGQTFRYHCRECGREFEAREARRSETVCPECGASGARSIAKL